MRFNRLGLARRGYGQYQTGPTTTQPRPADPRRQPRTNVTASKVVSASTASTSELRNAVVTAGAAVVQFTSGTGSSTFLHLCHPLTLSRMTACPLTQNENEHDHQHRKDRRGDWTAQGEPTMFYGLV